jgi:hypothetical protein
MVEKKPKTEAGYLVERRGDEHFEVQKWENGGITARYVVKYGVCSCPGYQHRGDCKHRDVVLKVTERQPTPQPVEQARATAVKVTTALRTVFARVELEGYETNRDGLVTGVEILVAGGDAPPQKLMGFRDGLRFTVEILAAGAMAVPETEEKAA